jgi:hypothetical protein
MQTMCFDLMPTVVSCREFFNSFLEKQAKKASVAPIDKKKTRLSR